jgi:TetR/AcrR family tetracycline transcriptional repressor
MTSRRQPGQRAGLTRQVVLVGAHELLVSGGLDAITVRGLARHLGVAPNAIYSHVADRGALLDDLLDDLLGEITEPDPDEVEPDAGLITIMDSTYRVLTAHATSVPAYLAQQGARGDNAMRLGKSMEGLLAMAGLTGADAREARRVLIIYTIGAAAFATAEPVTQRDGPRISRDEAHRNFVRGLKWLITGIVANNV